MATYVIGDIHGCLDQLHNLLDKLAYNQSDKIYFVGDLVNRGPKSLATLLFIKSLANAKIILGNHDGNLRNSSRQDAITPIVDALDHPNLFLLK